MRRALLLLLLTAGCLDQPSTFVREGNRAALAGRLDEAVSAYGRAIDARPGDPRPRLLLAHALLALHRDEEARAAYAAVLERDARSGEARLGLATVRLRANDPDAALALLASVPSTPPSHLLAARAYLARGNPGDATAALAELAGTPSPEARYLLASALLVVHRYADAQATLQALEATSPSLARYGMARLAAAQGRPTDVSLHLEAAQEAAGDQWDAVAVAADPAFDFVGGPSALHPSPK